MACHSLYFESLLKIRSSLAAGNESSTYQSKTLDALLLPRGHRYLFLPPYSPRSLHLIVPPLIRKSPFSIIVLNENEGLHRMMNPVEYCFSAYKNAIKTWACSSLWRNLRNWPFAMGPKDCHACPNFDGCDFQATAPPVKFLVFKIGLRIPPSSSGLTKENNIPVITPIMVANAYLQW